MPLITSTRLLTPWLVSWAHWKRTYDTLLCSVRWLGHCGYSLLCLWRQSPICFWRGSNPQYCSISESSRCKVYGSKGKESHRTAIGYQSIFWFQHGIVLSFQLWSFSKMRMERNMKLLMEKDLSDWIIWEILAIWTVFFRYAQKRNLDSVSRHCSIFLLSRISIVKYLTSMLRLVFTIPMTVRCVCYGSWTIVLCMKIDKYIQWNVRDSP